MTDYEIPVEFRLPQSDLDLIAALQASGIATPEQATRFKNFRARQIRKAFLRQQEEFRERADLVNGLTWRQRRQVHRHNWAAWYIRQRYFGEEPK